MVKFTRMDILPRELWMHILKKVVRGAESPRDQMRLLQISPGSVPSPPILIPMNSPKHVQGFTLHSVRMPGYKEYFLCRGKYGLEDGRYTIRDTCTLLLLQGHPDVPPTSDSLEIGTWSTDGGDGAWGYWSIDAEDGNWGYSWKPW